VLIIQVDGNEDSVCFEVIGSHFFTSIPNMDNNGIKDELSIKLTFTYLAVRWQDRSRFTTPTICVELGNTCSFLKIA
jgi:hypothetical protein